MDLLDYLVIHGNVSICTIIVEDTVFRVDIGCEPGKCQDTPKEVEDEGAVVDLLHEEVDLLFDERINCAIGSFCVGVHIFLVELRHILNAHESYFLFCHAVVRVIRNAVFKRIGVVQHALVQIVSEIHGHWVPACILVVDHQELAVVG